MRNMIALIPSEFAVLLIVAAGIAMIVGARKLAGALLMIMAAIVFLPLVLAPVFELMPVWLLTVLILCFGFGLVRALFELTIGKRSTEHMVGILAADVVRFSALAPFRLLRWLFRSLTRN